MYGQFSYEALEQLIADVEMATQGRTTLIHPPNVWKHELSAHPDRFKMDDGELLWLGCKVGTIGSEQNQDKFWNLVNKYVSDGVISKGDKII